MRNIDLSASYRDIYENRRAARNPESQTSDKKYDRVRGEKTPMPPRGDKRREDFEKWYAKQMREDHAVAWEEYQQLDEVAPLIAAAAGGLAKAGAAKAATTGAAKMGGGLAKAASSKMGKAAINAGSSAVGNSVEKKVNEETELLDEKEGKKDACYNKVKSRFDVWPSAYASGALVKCRQKGAKNWGNSSKKEEVEYTENENYTDSYMEGYKELPKHKMQDKAAMKPDTARGEKQARTMDTVRNATAAHPGTVKKMVKGVEMANKKSGLERKYNSPSADNAAEKSRKNKAYGLENQRRQDLNKRYGPKKEELEAVFRCSHW